MCGSRGGFLASLRWRSGRGACGGATSMVTLSVASRLLNLAESGWRGSTARGSATRNGAWGEQRYTRARRRVFERERRVECRGKEEEEETRNKSAARLAIAPASESARGDTSRTRSEARETPRNGPATKLGPPFVTPPSGRARERRAPKWPRLDFRALALPERRSKIEAWEWAFFYFNILYKVHVPIVRVAAARRS